MCLTIFPVDWDWWACCSTAWLLPTYWHQLLKALLALERRKVRSEECTSFYAPSHAVFTPLSDSPQMAPISYRQQRQQQSSGEIFYVSWKVWNTSPLLDNGPNLRSAFWMEARAGGALGCIFVYCKSPRIVSPALSPGAEEWDRMACK